MTRGGRLTVVWLLALGVCIAIAATPGSGSPLLGLAAVVFGAAPALAVALLMLAIALGFGCWLEPLVFPACVHRLELRLAVGLAAALTVWHLAGIAGLLGPVASWVIACVGLAGLWRPLWRARIERKLPTLSNAAWVGVFAATPAIAILLTAASSPPGALWSSEFGGYDALTYHLPLPSAWLEAGRVWPLETNVYSFLPSYVEVAFAQIGSLTFAPPREGLEAGDGGRLLACHYFHAMLALGAAWVVAAVTHRQARGSLGDNAGSFAAALAFAVALLTPWTIVVGSLAYNEMGVVLLGAGALLAAISTELGIWRRGLIAGALVGVACGVKPTALFLIGPGVGVALVAHVPWRNWHRAVLPGALAGVAVLLPWLIRNWLAAGNPVFPLGIDLFGGGHWTPFQAEAWARSHSFDGSLTERLRTALWIAPDAGSGAPTVQRWRGPLNPQWGGLFPAAVFGIIAAVASSRTRRAAGVLACGLVLGFVAWFGLTHVQSRFLLPMLIFAAPAVGLGAAAVAELGLRAMTRIAAAAVCGVQAALLIGLWLSQNGGQPNALLLPGPSALKGAGIVHPRDAVTPTQFVNALEFPGRVALLGDAKTVYLRAPAMVSTAWDRTPLERAMIEKPGDPAWWIQTLRDEDVGVVIVDVAELTRLWRSGYTPPQLGPDAGRRLLDRLRVLRSWPERGVAVARVP